MKNKSKMAKLLVLSLVPIALVLMVSVQPGEAVAPGVTFVVNSTADLVDAFPGDGACATAGNVCTLRAAIKEANFQSGHDEIRFDASFNVQRTILVDVNLGPLPAIADDLTITGPGANVLTIDANQTGSVFRINLGVVVLSDVTITGGNAGASGGGGILNGGTLTLANVTVSGNSADFGGGIYNDVGGTLTVNSSTVSGNTTPTTSFAGGGGIYSFGIGRTVTLNSSTISGNTGFVGGGLWIYQGTLILNNSTVSGNVARYGGGINTSNNSIILTLNNSTISGNTGNNGGSGIRTGEYATTTLKNTIVAGNLGFGDCEIFATGSVVNSQGHNLDSDGTCGLTGPGDKTTPNPLLGLLADNGGPTKTHALLPGSPAIDKGGDCLAVDQRGVPRPQGAACDIGAYEVGAAPTVAACAPRPADMVAWWPLDELSPDGEYDDMAGGDNNGTPIGNPSQIPKQYVGNSLQAGIGKFVAVADAPNLNFGMESFTIDAWVKLTPDSQTDSIAYKLGGPSGGGYFLYIVEANQTQWRLQLQIANQPYAGPIITAPQGTWIFVAATVDKTSFSTGTVNLYVGVPGSPLVISNDQAGPFNASSHGTPLLIGRWSGNPHASLGIDEVETFSRALPKPEIESLFAAGSLGKCKPTCLTPPPSGLVAWWPLDESQGSQVVQNLAGGHHGTPMNFGGAVTTIGASGGPEPVTGYYAANSLLFDGAYVEVPDSPTLNFGGNGKDAFTIDAWVKYYPLAQTRPIVSKRASQNGPGYFLSIEPAGAGVFNLTLQIDGVKYTGPEVPNSKWAFVAATRNASGVTLYVGYNNTLTKLTVPGSPENASSTNTPLWIGQSQPVHPHTHSEIDEVEIFNRALDELEVEGLFRADWAGKCKTQAGKGTVIIRKNTVGGNDTFGYTTDGAGLTAFNITTSGGTGSQIFTNIASGPWTVTEASPPPGWVFTSLVCSDPYGGTTVSGQTANLDIESDETVICTYTNTKCPAITLNPAAGALPAPAINTPYSQTFSATGGCSSSFNYSVTSGALPNGLTLGADGALSGTATQAGSYDFTVTATDTCGCSQSQTYTLKPNARRGDFAFTRGMNEFCIWGGGGGSYNSPTAIDNPYSQTPIGSINLPFRQGNTSGVRYGAFGLCYGRILWANDKFAFKYTFNAIPVAVLSYRDVNPDLGFPGAVSETRRNVFGAGLSPIGFQLYFRPQNRIKPFVNISGGFIFFKDPVPQLNGAQFNFAYDFGGGVQVFRDSRRAFTFGYKYQRLSNGSRELNNRGFDGNLFYFGYSIFN